MWQNQRAGAIPQASSAVPVAHRLTEGSRSAWHEGGSFLASSDCPIAGACPPEFLMNDERLNGLRVLVVEDEAAISMLLEDMLMDFGCAIVGPAARLNVAVEMAQSDNFDVAILDVNLAGESIYPVADALAEQKRPFVFSTGYGGAGIKDPYRDRPVVQKPFSQQELRRTIITALDGAKS